MSPVDLALLERWKTERDAEAFAELVGRYGRLVYSTARRILGNTPDTEDVAQDSQACLLTEWSRSAIMILPHHANNRMAFQ